MKKWKRFIAACLSVTMIASTPLSTFANSSVSLEQFTPKEKKELNVDNKKVEVTDFEKILSQEAPYEYFSKQKNWQNILDSLEDEELFQMKELMKYAYIYETSAENRQSLDAYLFILEDWKKRDLPNDSEKQAKLIQEVLEKSKVYEVPYGDKKVVDLSTFVEYMQGFKEFDVLKYIEVFTGLEQAQNDDELKAAKAAFENFENEIYGFEEKREELKAEDKTANPEKAENSEILTSPAEDIEVPDKVPETATPYSVDGDTKWIPNVKQWKDAVPAQSIVVDTPFTLDNMASISISKDDYILGIFQPDGWNMPAIMYNGTINANEVKSLSDIVIKWNNIGHDKDNDRIDMEVTFSNIHVKGAPYSATNPRLIARSTNTEIEALYGKYFLELGSEVCRLSTDVHVKYLKRGTNTLANGDYIGYFTDIDAPDYGEIYNTEYSEKTITGIGISDIYTSNTCFLDIHKENGEYRLESTKYDNNTLDSGFVMKTQPEFSFTVKVAAASTQILKQFNPGTITATAGPGGSISDEGTTSIPWKNDKDYTITPDKGYHIKDVIVDGKPQGPIPNYHFPPIAEEDHTIEAQFEPNTYTITYEGNGGTWKEQSSWSENVVYNTEYTTQSNFFERPGHTFIGWNEKPDGSGTDWTEYIGKPWKWTYDRDVTLYAIWDKAPEITFSDNFKDSFYEGTTVTRQDLLNEVIAQDDIDQDISDKIIITQIDYSAGRLSGNGKDKAYSQKWADGMPADAVLDTWFMKLDKNDSPVKHKITYQVKDSAGNVTTATKEVRVIYNEFPEIKAIDQRYTLNEAQNGFITEDALLQDLIDAGTLSASDKEESDLSAKLELVDFDPSVFTSMKKEGFVPVTYRVQDSMGPDGKGKETLKTVYVHIFVVRPGEEVKYVRFINKEYYEKNANLPLSSLTEQEIALYAVNGGLHPRSKWYSDPSYASVIKATFNKTSGDVYTYTKEDIKKMRDFVKEHGVGNAKETDGLNKFADTFMTGKYKK